MTIDFAPRTAMDLRAEVLAGGERSEARAATALIEKVIDRIADDVSAAAQPAAASGQRTC